MQHMTPHPSLWFALTMCLFAVCGGESSSESPADYGADAAAPDADRDADSAVPEAMSPPDGFAVTYHPATNTLATVMHGQTSENYGVAFLASGDQSAVLEATESTGDVGHFNPRITANRLRNEWLMVTSRGFQTIVAQRLGP